MKNYAGNEDALYGRGFPPTLESSGGSEHDFSLQTDDSSGNQQLMQEGYKSLFKGWVSSMFGILHAVVYFPIYENLKVLLSDGD